MKITIFSNPKKRLFSALLLAFFTSAVFAQTVKISKTDAFCGGDGKVGITVTGAKPGSSLSFELFKQPENNTAFRSNFEADITTSTVIYTEDNLPEATYKLKVVETVEGIHNDLGVITFTIGRDFTPINAEKDIKISTETVCDNKAELTVNVTGKGRPVRYALFDLNGAEIFPYQDSNKFPPVASGNYRVGVEDVCGNRVTKDLLNVTVTTSEIRPDHTFGSFPNCGSRRLISCNTIDFKASINGHRGTASTLEYIEKFQYPVRLTVTIARVDQNDTPLEVLFQEEKEINNISEAQTGMQVHAEGFNLGDRLMFKATTVDACGIAYTSTGYTTYTPEFKIRTKVAKCGANYLELYDVYYFPPASATKITFDKYPVGFKPWEYNSDFSDGEYSHIYNTNINYLKFGSLDNPVLPGEYEITITNDCGASVTQSISVREPALNAILNYSLLPDCEEGWNHINYYYSGDQTEISKVVITQAPREFLDHYGCTLPFNAEEHVRISSNQYKEFRMRVPEGDYTFEITNDCGQTKTINLSATEKYNVDKGSLEVSRYCGGYFTVNSSARLTKKNNQSLSASYYSKFLQKWYPEANAWGDPTTGYTGDELDPKARTSFGSSSQFYVDGKFRVILIPRLFYDYETNEFGRYVFDECPTFYEVGEFTIPKGSVALNDYYVMGCDNGTYSLLIDATGVGDELKYEITHKDGQPFPVNNGNNPVFGNLPPGEYKVMITDPKCGDASTYTVKLLDNKFPAIKAQELCEGENGRLYVNGASYLTVEWFKNGTPLNISGHALEFSPYDPTGDEGLYEAKLSYDNNPNWCVSEENRTISFYLSPQIMNNAHAGEGTEVTVVRNEMVDGFVNLFDYLKEGVPYDKHGEWTEITTETGYLMGSKWFITHVPGGTYQFRYAVDGTCESHDETTVTIHLIGTNFWHGTVDSDWSNPENWTAGLVPGDGEDIEFATDANNGALGSGNGKGAARNDLHLDTDRTIGNLVNASGKDLWVTTGNELVVDGKVDNSSTGTIVVKADPDNQKTNGTLRFADPSENNNVQATVEFYNKAYECDNCGFYRKQWQYFGIPVLQAEFPATGNETVNQWSEPTNGNKWVTPASPMSAFKGYQITANSTTLPSHIYGFKGLLAAGEEFTVPLSKSTGVNFPGANLIGNSFTAAIPIADGLTLPPEVSEKTIYLFNTGTRDQWRKLNGEAIQNVAAGQYLAVPVNLAGQNDLPDMIPSTHAFMVFADRAAQLTIDYHKLVKNKTVKDGAGNEIATRSATVPAPENGSDKKTSAGSRPAIQPLPSVRMDVIGKASADRLWVFHKPGTSHAFDSGWDGRKMEESGIAQLYVAASDSSRLQVATVPDMHNVRIGFVPDDNGSYTLEFSLSEQLRNAEIYLYDEARNVKERIHHGGSYTFEAGKGEKTVRFRLTSTAAFSQLSTEEELIDVTASADGRITISNRSKNDCSAFISGREAPRERIEVRAGGERTIEGLPKGTYVVRLQNAEVTDARKVTIQ